MRNPSEYRDSVPSLIPPSLEATYEESKLDLNVRVRRPLRPRLEATYEESKLGLVGLPDSGRVRFGSYL